MHVQHFYDPETHTLSYVVHKKGGTKAIVIDPVWNFEQASGMLHTRSLNELLDYFKQHNLSPAYCLETHAHADHISSAQQLKRYFPNMKIAISHSITKVQHTFAKLYGIEHLAFKDNGGFDHLWKDFEQTKIADLNVKVLPTQGHTPACISYLIEDSVFVGDCIFMPDSGTGRCDFPGASAAELYDSITKNLYTLEPETKVFVGHDYQFGGRELKYMTTIKDQMNCNSMLPATSTRNDFIEKRIERDKSLSVPKLLLASMQINILAGQLLLADDNGNFYLKIPITLES